jgi:hypothetical protein
MSLRDEIRDAIARGETSINYFGKSVTFQRNRAIYSVNKTANLWYSRYYPEPRFMCPSVDSHRSFTKAELQCIS